MTETKTNKYTNIGGGVKLDTKVDCIDEINAI